jgi:hypothetical protein
VILGTVGDNRRLLLRNHRQTCEADSELTLEMLASGKRAQTFALKTLSEPAICSDREWHLDKGDYNFDGFEDFAVPLDSAGPYGSETYAIFVFDPRAMRYVAAPALSELTNGYMGMFEVDARRKRLVASSKSGCCIHWVSEFSIRGRQPLLERQETVTHSFENEKCEVVTELTRRNARKKTTRRPCTKEEL